MEGCYANMTKTGEVEIEGIIVSHMEAAVASKYTLFLSMLTAPKCTYI